MKYFFDNCISFRYANMLAALGVDAVALRDSYDAAIDDIALFGELSGSDFVFISAYKNQTTRLQEARAMKEAGITCLSFGPFVVKKKYWDQATWLVARWPAIDDYAKTVKQATIAEIKQNGAALVIHL